MDMHEISKRFADGATSGRASNIFIEGDCIYSYGHHFVMAKRVQDEVLGEFFLFNSDYYSSSTSKQQSAVRGALTLKNIIRYDGAGEYQPTWKNVVQCVEDKYRGMYENFLQGNDVAAATKLLADTVQVQSSFLDKDFDSMTKPFIERTTNRKLINLLASSKEFPYLRELALVAKGKGFPKRGVIRKAMFANQELPQVSRRNKKYRFIESIKNIGAVAASIASAHLDGGYLAGVVCRDAEALTLVDSFYSK